MKFVPGVTVLLGGSPEVQLSIAELSIIDCATLRFQKRDHSGAVDYMNSLPAYYDRFAYTRDDTGVNLEIIWDRKRRTFKRITYVDDAMW
jgi:hypothetical protein